MKTISKLTDSAVIVGSAFVGFGAVKTVMTGVKAKSTGTIVFGTLALLISIYALKEAVQKINE